jgi:hypothetical protein
VLPDLLGQRLQDDVVGGDVTRGRPGLQRSQLSAGAALLADAHRPAEEVDVLHPQSACLADPQPQADQRDHQGPVGEECRGEHRGDAVVGQVDLAPARRRGRLDRRGRVRGQQAVGDRGVQDLPDLAQHLLHRARCQGLRPPSEGRGHGARPDRTHRVAPEGREDVPVRPGPLADSRRVCGQEWECAAQCSSANSAEVIEARLASM